MLRKWVALVSAAAVSVGGLSCTDDEGDPPGAGFGLSQLLGTWVLTRTVSSWNYTEAGQPTSGTEDAPEIDTTEVLDFDSTLFADYLYAGGCYDVVAEAFQMSGATIVSDWWTGSYSDASGSETWTTTAARSGALLVLTEYDAWDYGVDDKGWERDVYYYAPYGGAIPPADWPTQLCKMAQLQSRRHR